MRSQVLSRLSVSAFLPGAVGSIAVARGATLDLEPFVEALATRAEAIPEDNLARDPVHRVFVRPDDPAFEHLNSRGAVPSSEDHGSYLLVRVDVPRVGGLAALKSLDLALQDEVTLINVNGYSTSSSGGGE